MISWSLKNRSLRPIGLDIGYSSIKMIQLVISGGRISVLAADKARIDASINGDEQERRNFIISTVKRMLAEGNFHGRNVIVMLTFLNTKISF